MTTTHVIYGLYESPNECFYVGQTKNATRREREWRKQLNPKTFEFRILEHTNDAQKREMETIRNLRSKGQAKMNVRYGHNPKTPQNIEIAERLLKKRQARGIFQKFIANKMKISPVTLCLLEKSELEWTPELVQKYEEALA